MENKKIKGLVIRFNRSRLDLLTHHDQFSEPAGDFSYSRNLPLTCFIINESGLIKAVALGTRGVKAGTGLRRVNLFEIIFLSTKVHCQDIENKTPNRLKKRVASTLAYGGLFTSKGFFSVIELLTKIAPELEEVFERFSVHRYKRIQQLSENKRKSLARQKEALTTALMLGGFDRTELREWSPPENNNELSFLDGLASCRLREDQMIINDLQVFPKMELLKTTPYSSAVFQGENKRLTVILANKLELEKQTGTDLIYYNETYNSFVMIQYKALEKEAHDAVFRFPSSQLTEEIERMDQILGMLNEIKTQDKPDNFRICENPFFLKFCAREVLNPDDSGLIPGMYLPLDFWKTLDGCGESLIGPKGGRFLSYKNVGRYFDNTEFTHLVSKSWVGTRIEQSEVLEKIIEEIITTGKAAMLAIRFDEKNTNKKSQ